jgi:hypothetical protein
MINPFPLSRHPLCRTAACASQSDGAVRRATRRPVSAKCDQRAPPCIPDERFDELFARLGSHRDRALVAFRVSTGARASELLVPRPPMSIRGSS